MFCDEALEVVEAIAGGELMPDGRVAAHMATCPHCALALEHARQVEASLRLRPAPAAPPQFTSRTLARIRRARWHSDQVLDVAFNVAIGTLVAALVGGVWLLLHRTGLAAVSRDAVAIFGSGFVSLARRVAPSVPLYAGAAALLASALGLWWWAERDAAL